MTTATHSNQFAKHVLWLALGFGSVMLAIAGLTIQTKKQSKTPPATPKTAETAVTPHLTNEKIAATAHIGTFDKEVLAISTNQRQISNAINGDHEPEYRGSKFVVDHKDQWTLQVMQVRDEDIIRAYLNKRDDRSKFTYLALNESKGLRQFVLLYGVYNDAQSAARQLPSDHFGLPSRIAITPQKISNYRSKVNDMGSDEKQSATTLRNVVLKKVAIPKPRSTVVQLSNLSPQQLENIGASTVVKTRDRKPEVDRPRQVKPIDRSDDQVEKVTQPQADEGSSSAGSDEPKANHVAITESEPKTNTSPDNEVTDPF